MLKTAVCKTAALKTAVYKKANAKDGVASGGREVSRLWQYVRQCVQILSYHVFAIVTAVLHACFALTAVLHAAVFIRCFACTPNIQK